MSSVNYQEQKIREENVPVSEPIMAAVAGWSGAAPPAAMIRRRIVVEKMKKQNPTLHRLCEAAALKRGYKCLSIVSRNNPVIYVIFHNLSILRTCS